MCLVWNQSGSQVSSGFVLFFQLVESEEQLQQTLADALVEETTFTVNVWVHLSYLTAEVNKSTVDKQNPSAIVTLY